MEPARPRVLPRLADEHRILGAAPALSRDVLGFLTGLERELGPVAAFRMVNATWVLVSHADGVEQVLVDPDRAFEKPDAIYGPGRLLFGNSLTGLNGSTWRTRRRLVAPAFHRLPVADERIVGLTRSWAQERADGPAFRIDTHLTELMLEVAATSLLRSSPGQAAKLAAPISSVFAGMARRMRLGVPVPDWLPIAPVRQMRAGVAEMRRFVEAEARRRRPVPGDPDADLLDALLLLAADPDHDIDVRGACDEVAVSMAVGGHQMATALTWTLFLLAEHPEERERLRVEADAALDGAPSLDALPALPHAAHVIEEAMRLYPPFHVIGREALTETTVAGHRVPAGATVVLSPWVTHRLERYYEDPLAFRPARWENGAARRLPRGAFFPTGGGGRLCVAQAAMRKELLLVLTTLLQSHDVVLAPGQRGTPQPGTSLGMRGGLTGRLVRAR